MVHAVTVGKLFPGYGHKKEFIMVGVLSCFFLYIVLIVTVACDGYTESRQEEERMNINRQDVRAPAYAGSWYEGNPDRLRASVENYMENAKFTHGLGKIVGIISPHAGHIYSGPVAGYAYKHIIGKKFDTVIVVAPNHSDPNLNFSSVYTRGGYDTPLGLVSVDVESAKAVVDFGKSDNI